MRRRPDITERKFDRSVEELRAYIRKSVSAFPGDTAERKEKRIRKAANDREYFCRMYMPHYFTDESAPFHRELDELIAQSVKPSVVEAPRGFSKTTRVSFANPLHAICFELKKFILIISETETQAELITGAIKAELDENPRIRSDFGDMKTDEWADKEFVAATGTKVLARGAGQAVRGLKHGPHRPDLIIIDDLESDASAKSPRRIKNTLNWILEAVLPARPPQGGTFFMVGTRLSRRSVLAQLMVIGKERGFITKTYRAIENGQSLWPARFPLEILEEIKNEVGTNAFNKEYMNDPKDEDGIIQEEWLQYDTLEVVESQTLAVYDYLDPSLGRNESSDFRAFIKVGKNPDGIIWALECDIKRRSIDSVVQSTYARQAQRPALKIGIESVAFQEVLLTLFSSEASQYGYHLPLSGVSQTLNKEIRVSRLSPLIERGTLRFIKGYTDQPTLIEQLIYFPSPSVHDDGPDALEGAVSLAETPLTAGATQDVDSRHYRTKYGRERELEALREIEERDPSPDRADGFGALI